MLTLFVKGNLIEHKWSEQKSELDKHRPLDYIMEWFKVKLSKKPSSPIDRILILQSETGSGKSTVIPPEFYHRFFKRAGERNICCTQPRVLTTIELPNTIIPYHTGKYMRKMGLKNRTPLKIGDNIGYQTMSFIKKPIRGIIYMTIGVLQQQLNFMPENIFINYYSLIVLDEIHERSLGTDIVLYKIKKFIQKHYNNPRCPFVLITSATFDPFYFCDYLLSNIPKNIRYKNIIKVSGLSHPIKEIFLKYDSNDYIKEAVNTIIKIYESEEKKGRGEDNELYQIDEDRIITGGAARKKFNDILIFVHGIREINNLYKEIITIVDNPLIKKKPFIILKLTGTIVKEQKKDYQQLFISLKKLKNMNGKTPFRRIILSTNVAETGITFNNLKYVIDSGWHKSSEFNPNFSSTLLVNKPVTQGMYKQRRGRVGRLTNGVCYALYTKKTYDMLQSDQYPDIITSDNTLDVLNLIIMNIDYENENINTPLNKILLNDKFINKINSRDIDFLNIDLMDLPTIDNIHYSFEKLYQLGAINSNSIPTLVGFIMNKFRMITAEAIKMILNGYIWDVSIIDLVTIASFVIEKRFELFIKSRNMKTPMFKFGPEYNSFLISGDFIEYLLIFNQFQKQLENLNINVIGGDESHESIEEWCKNRNLNFNTLLQVLNNRDNIITTLSLIGLNPYHNVKK